MGIPLKKGYVFDLDGTVYLGERLIPGAREVVGQLRALGCKVTFLSNKPVATREQYAQKLCRLGIQTDASDVVNSSWVTARYLSRRAPGARVYPIGEPPLLRDLEAVGLVVATRPQDVEFVIAAFDRTFNYDKLNFAFQAIKNGAHFIATNADRACPTAEGEIPDAAGVVAALEATTGKPCELVVGKPAPMMLQTVLDRMDLAAQQCAMVGDRLGTDVKMGNAAGTTTVLVLTGVTTREMLEVSEIQPDYVLESIARLVDE